MEVIVSMISSNRKKVYHKPDCIYVKKMKPRNRMVLTESQARSHHFHSCKYCGGLKGEVRVYNPFPDWEKQYHIAIDYAEKTETLYIRTEIGCWKIFCKEKLGKYLLYHKNIYRKEMTFGQIVRGEYHRQTDVSPTSSLHHLINYIVEHDRAKQIMEEDYRRLPKKTARQRKYYRQAERRVKRRERRQMELRISQLFASIEEKDPSMSRRAFC